MSLSDMLHSVTSRVRVRRWVLAMLVSVCAAGPAVAQSRAPNVTPSVPPQSTMRSVDGRVRRPVRVRPDSNGTGPAVGAWVTVHRVGKDSAGPIDSVRTNLEGHYALRWRSFGAADAVYFASVTWDGIAYFTPPLRATDSRGDAAEITVFDTTSHTFPLSVKGRHLIVGKADTAEMRTVIEVFELSNDSLKTLIAAEQQAPAPTWSITVPQSAIDVRASEGEISPDAFIFAPGRVSVFAPIAPGVKQVSFSYRVPAASFPLAFAADRGAVVFEVLVEDPQGTVTGPGFAAVDPVTLENRNFRRYLAQDVKDGARLTVDMPAAQAPARNLYISGLLIVIGSLMVFALARAMQRRGSGGNAAPARGGPPRVIETPLHERLAHEIAALDATFANIDVPSETDVRAHDRRRAELKDALGHALAVTTVAR